MWGGYSIRSREEHDQLKHNNVAPTVRMTGPAMVASMHLRYQTMSMALTSCLTSSLQPPLMLSQAFLALTRYTNSQLP